MDGFPTARWCRSRRAGVICTRAAGHPGLHNRVGTSQMWSELEADPPACAGGGRHAAKARLLPGGFPGGRALCLVCWGFVELSPDETLAAHDAFRGAGSEEEASSRAAWFNTYGWDRG